MDLWCNGSMMISKIIGGGSSPSRSAKGYVPLAQWIRASGYEPEGRGFKSLTGLQNYGVVVKSYVFKRNSGTVGEVQRIVNPFPLGE